MNNYVVKFSGVIKKQKTFGDWITHLNKCYSKYKYGTIKINLNKYGKYKNMVLEWDNISLLRKCLWDILKKENNVAYFTSIPFGVIFENDIKEKLGVKWSSTLLDCFYKIDFVDNEGYGVYVKLKWRESDFKNDLCMIIEGMKHFKIRKIKVVTPTKTTIYNLDKLCNIEIH